MDRGAWRATVHGVTEVKYGESTLKSTVVPTYSSWCKRAVTE